MSTKAARRRRAESQVPDLLAILAFLGMLIVLNVVPTWEDIPFLTLAAHSAVELLTLSLILCIVARVIGLVGADPRLRAGVMYVVALVNLAVLGQLWSAFPFDFSFWPEGWSTVARWAILALAVWDVLMGVRAAVVTVRGRRHPRLARSTSTL